MEAVRITFINIYEQGNRLQERTTTIEEAENLVEVISRRPHYVNITAHYPDGTNVAYPDDFTLGTA